MASSLARRVARANCMFITLTQPISSTPTQKPSIVSRVPRSGSGVYVLSRGSTWPVLNCLLVSGYASAKCFASADTSALAWSSETPVLSKASTDGLTLRGSLRSRTGNSL